MLLLSVQVRSLSIRRLILRLNELQRRRGPDGAGLWSSDDNRIVLGHRRLAIIDTSSAGAQPMRDATGRWVITFNGEIYNYRALRMELEQLGCRLCTNSDTEVLINAIAQWGEAGLRKLRGMYAFALWDSLQQELWLARDPYGIKPLYVSEGQGTIWFASQARALASCAPVDTKRDPAALTGFYLWGHVPEPFSWWAGIQMFPAGHVQRIRVGRAPFAPKAFARVEDAYVCRPAQPLAPGELRGLMLDSMQHHLVADVPVGVFLSAGIDSNAIAALAAELGTQLRTVTLAFDEYAGTPDDEAPLAEAAAKILRSDHVTVRIGRGEFEQLLDDFLTCMDQPTIDGLNTYLVSRAAATQGLKVALSGVGGDELFGGYPSFSQIPKLLRWGRHVPFAKPLGRAVQAVFACDVAAGYSAQGCWAAFVFRRYRECLPFAARPVSRGRARCVARRKLVEARSREAVDSSNNHANCRAPERGGRNRPCTGRRARVLLVHAQPVTARHRLVEHGAWTGSARALCRCNTA